MRDFLLIFEGGGDPDWTTKQSPAEIREGLAAWGAWFEELEKTGNLRNPGAALENEGAALASKNGEVVLDTLSPELKELIGGYSVVQAESLDSALEMAKGCPIFHMDPPGRVHVRPIFEMPTD